MKRIVLAAAFVALGSASALAADLPPRSYAKAPAMAPVTNWSGLYIGGNFGYGWGNGNTAFSFLPDDPAVFDNTTLDTKSKGATGGAQIGYNWQMGAIVTGLEADIQGSGIEGSAKRSPFFDRDSNSFIPGSFLSTEQKLSWFGTVRGRLGVTVTPDLLLYATGGLAYGHVDASANIFFNSTDQFPATVSKTKAGWTVGAGAEWMFARNWSAKVEYLYLDLGNVSGIGHKPDPSLFGAAAYTWKTQENIVRAGVNYHF
jgi:outer membrane immunogenic protein